MKTRITLLLTTLVVVGLTLASAPVAAEGEIILEGQITDKDWDAVDDDLYLIDADSGDVLDETDADDGLFDLDKETALRTTETDADLELRLGDADGDAPLFPNASILENATVAANETDANTATVVIADDADDLERGTATFENTDGDRDTWSFYEPPEDDETTDDSDDDSSPIPQAADSNEPEAYNESATEDDDPPWYDGLFELPEWLDDLLNGDDDD